MVMKYVYCHEYSLYEGKWYLKPHFADRKIQIRVLDPILRDNVKTGYTGKAEAFGSWE